MKRKRRRRRRRRNRRVTHIIMKRKKKKDNLFMNKRRREATRLIKTLNSETVFVCKTEIYLSTAQCKKMKKVTNISHRYKKKIT
jgi:hypothetical protein